MALIIEDGSGKSDSNSYISVADADKYHELRGNKSWALLSDDDKEIYLVRATDFMVQEYRTRWKGSRVKLDQALDWPRGGVVIEDVAGQSRYSYGRFEVGYDKVPTEVKNACAELGLRASMGVLVKDQSQAVVSKTVGPVTVVYDKDSSRKTEYLAVDMMLEPYLRGSSAMVKLGRA